MPLVEFGPWLIFVGLKNRSLFSSHYVNTVLSGVYLLLRTFVLCASGTGRLRSRALPRPSAWNWGLSNASLARAREWSPELRAPLQGSGPRACAWLAQLLPRAPCGLAAQRGVEGNEGEGPAWPELGCSQGVRFPWPRGRSPAAPDSLSKTEVLFCQ